MIGDALIDLLITQNGIMWNIIQEQVMVLLLPTDPVVMPLSMRLGKICLAKLNMG